MIDPRHPDYANTPVSPQRPDFHYAPDGPAQRPVVSIVTPFHNTRDVLHETARNMLGQSLQQWEWILVNDASTDPAALAVLDQYRARDPRIRVVDHDRNRGPGAARNTGYREARADFIFQMDDDDLMEPTALEKMRWYLESYPEVAVVNGWSVAFGAKEYLWPTGFDRGDELLTANLATGRAMVRRSAHAAAGGFDESIRGGMEDWDFWLRLADAGHWGATIPEYLDWYRRRDDHSLRWRDWDSGNAQQRFIERLRTRYARLYADGVPRLTRRYPSPMEPAREHLPFTNPLRKSQPRVLLIMPWMAMGGADKVNLDLVAQLSQRGWQSTIATTLPGDYSWAAEFGRFTPDIFILPNFVAPADHPAFLRYLIDSRRPDVVLCANSELAYLLLPYLRTVCPQPAYVDLCHSESRAWKAGGYPRYTVANQELLDLSLVSTGYLKNWMTTRGGDAARIEVVYTGVDPARWSPAPDLRAATRARLAVDEATPVILFSGRLHPDKQPRVLGGTLCALRDRGCVFRAWVTGDGPDRPWLEDFLSRNNLAEQVRLLGNVPVDEVPALMAAADIFFLPSLWEGIALTLFEAMASGLAVVGANVGAQAELVTPQTGILIQRDTEDTEIQTYARELAALITDPARRRALAAAARQRIVGGFTYDDFGRRTEQLLRRAMHLHDAEPRPALPPRFARETATLAIEHMRMSTLLDYYWLAAHGQSSEPAADPADERIRTISSERDAAWAEAQKLARAWETHVAYIREMEAENRRLTENLRDAHASSLYHRARRIVGGALRQTGLVRRRRDGTQ